jgi:hypothetical protein
MREYSTIKEKNMFTKKIVQHLVRYKGEMPSSGGEQVKKIESPVEEEKKAKEWTNKLLLNLAKLKTQKECVETFTIWVNKLKEVLWSKFTTNSPYYQKVITVQNTINPGWWLFDTKWHLQENAQEIFSQLCTKIWVDKIWLNQVNEGKSSMWDLVLEIFSLINKAEQKWGNMKRQLEILQGTGVISVNILSLWARWFIDNSGESGAKAIISALKSAELWEGLQIVTYSNNRYQNQRLDIYEETIKNNPNQVNLGIVEWSIKAAKKWASIFKDDTWWTIWAYCEKMNWNNNLTNISSETKDFLKTKYAEYKKEKEIEIRQIISTETQRQIKEDPKLAQLLEANPYLKDDGSVDIDYAVSRFNATNPKEIKQDFKKLIEKLQNDVSSLKIIMSEKVEVLESKNIRSLGSLKINIPFKIPDEVKNLPFQSWTKDEIDRYLKEIVAMRKSQKDQKIIENLSIVIDVLQVKDAQLRKIKWIHSAEARSRQLDEAFQSWKEINQVTIRKILESDKAKTEEKIAMSIAETGSNLEDNSEWLQKKGIFTFEQAQEELTRLRNIKKLRPLTQEEKELWSSISKNFKIRQNQTLAYDNAVKSLWKEKAQDLFTEINRSVSKNPTRQCNFQNLEIACVIMNPESTKIDRSFARLEKRWVMSIGRFIEDTSTVKETPEIKNLKVRKNKDWTYSIEENGANWLSVKRITKLQAKEYIENIELFASIWLWQMIPHLPLIMNSLQHKWIWISMDGNRSSKEQRVLLEEIYKLLFWIWINTARLWEVYDAFRTKLNTPINQRQAMQSVLKKNKLLTKPNDKISALSIENWLNSDKIIDPTDKMKNI